MCPSLRPKRVNSLTVIIVKCGIDISFRNSGCLLQNSPSKKSCRASSFLCCHDSMALSTPGKVQKWCQGNALVCVCHCNLSDTPRISVPLLYIRKTRQLLLQRLNKAAPVGKILHLLILGFKAFEGSRARQEFLFEIVYLWTVCVP
ncbi:unnamed protein product [Arctogadus glacialis]